MPRLYSDIFDSLNIDFLYLNERAYEVGVYTPKQSIIGHCIFILTDYIQRNISFNIGVPRQYLDFFRFA